ncbi:MAG: hypothetical protein JO279_18770 [Verrucomicrobia bacterium]|nr:hypothetical protein [Verrucomicrobiota bacterium]
MKPKLYARSFAITFPGVPQPTEGMLPSCQPGPGNSQNAGIAQNKSPYPGINIGSASELLDFRFEETEIL